ncbi:MAG: alpha/beta fold hydrolase [Polyangia bacterium]
MSLAAGPRTGRRVARLGLVGLGALLVLGALGLLWPQPLPRQPSGHPAATGEDVRGYLARQLARSHQEGVLPGNEERLVQRGPGRAPVVILFVHGFGASRAEGEGGVEPLAAALGASVYYTRLPGHGGELTAHAAARAEQYFERMEEDFHHLRELGDKIVLIGSSTGALLCTWLAARHPDDVAALVLASPLFDFADPMSFLLSRRLGMPLIESLYGEYRDASWKSDPEQRKQAGYEAHWLTRQRFRALLTLDGLRRTIATDEVLSAVRAPVLMLYHYADAAHKDTVVSVPAMRRAFSRMNGGSPHPLSREVAIADGNHILLSAYVRTDKERILSESLGFLRAVLAAR